ncbi:MAG: hypothetical protein H8E37_01240 [Planctomycetes bacterium]|nr:hypothetical protein [Planctomycetota bacterium]
MKLASADSTDAQAQRNLSISYGKLGGMRLESGMVAEALEFFRKAMEIDEKLAAIDSADVGAQRDLSYSYYNMGEANLEARDESAAFDFFQQMLEIDKKLAAADPKNAEALRNVAISYDRVAAIELGRGNLSAARTLFEQQLAIVEQRLKLDSRNPDAHEMVYLVCYDLADLSLKMEQMADAIVYFRQAYGARFDYAAIKEKRNQYVQAVESYDGGLEVIDWIKRKNRLQPADEESFATATAAVTRCRKLLAAKPEPDPSLPLPEPDVSKPVAEPDLSKPADVAQEEEFVSGRPYLLKGRSLPTMLEQSVPYTKTEEGITKIGRHYIRTRSGQFLTRDFVYEVRFTLNTNDGIAFIGMGQGGRAGAYKEPGNSVHLRIHSTGRYRGEVGITSADDKSRKLINDKFGKLAEPGTHRVRITKRGNAVTFTLDVDDDGPSDDDMTKSFPDIHKAAPFLHSKNSFLFFGGDGTFSEVRLGKPEPTPEKPQLEPKKPEPASEKPEPEPEKPEPTPQKPKPEEPTLERFTLTGQWPAVLEKTIPFTQTRGGIGKIGRKYIRTKSGQFLDRDFTYEVQFTLKKDGGIAFIGFGAGLPNPSNFEPDDSVYLRLHAVGRYGGEVRIASAEAPNARYGVFRAPGTHRVRIIKSGQKVTFSVDVNDDGPTKDDMTKSFPDIRKVGPYLDSKNGYLFFGGDGTFSEVRLSR